MKKVIAILLIVTVAAGSCKKDETPEDGALMTNGSFEKNGSFSLDGWVTNNADQSLAVPAGGGSFSLKLSPGVYPSEGYADYTIEDLQGSKNITLSCEINAFDTWPGAITLKKIASGGAVTILATSASDENMWVEKILTVSAAFNTGDKLIIHLSAGSAEAPVASKFILFDLVEITID